MNEAQNSNKSDLSSSLDAVPVDQPAAPEATVVPNATLPEQGDLKAESLANPIVATSVQPTPPDNTPKPTSGPNPKSSTLTWILVLVVAVTMSGVGGFIGGRKTAPKPSLPTPAAPTASGLTIPPNATVIAQCAKNRGTQYVLPKDIPLGPVYNVYNNKVIGVEFMVGKDDLVGGKSYLNLPLNGQTFDHVNIGLLSTGHAGYPTPHYHIDIMTVPTSVTDQIRC